MTGPGPLTHRDAWALAGAPPSPHCDARASTYYE
jgi:hypothetical protein